MSWPARATLIPDIQGSIIGTLASDTGALTKTPYLAFGENPALATGGFRYTAQHFDAETASSVSQPSGLYYYRARMYSPTWGRFLQPDPLGYAAGDNLYAYVLNDPLNLTDPSGQVQDLANTAYHYASGLAQQYPTATGLAVTGLGVAATVGLEALSGGINTPALPEEVEASVAAGETTTTGLHAAEEAGSVLYSPINPGPLAEDIANTFRSGTYTGSPSQSLFE